ncbi:MAG: aminopeptidase P family protein [Phycisphaerales bacterium]|nr:MAG: aminopeptidase P family protein [Phycisphaerales bacterium]
MNKEIIRTRIRSIRRRMNENTVDCLILTRPANVTYATSFMGEDSWAVITPRRVYLLTDSRYTEQAEKECLDCRIIERASTLALAAARLITKRSSLKTVAVEKSASLADYQALRKNITLPLRTPADIVESVRAVKQNAEVSAIRAAASLAAVALQQTLKKLRPQMTENELAGLLDFNIRMLGAGNSFDTIVAFGPNASRPHHQPGRRKLKNKDTILIDFGARYKGYCSDITRCFALGAPTPLFRNTYDVVQKAQAAAMSLVKEGARLADIDAAARNVIRQSALPVYGHGTGHGFGLEIHEIPFLKAKAPGALRAGQVITMEPGVYIPGRLGVRIEDDLLVTETGCRVLTRSCPQSYRLHR